MREGKNWTEVLSPLREEAKEKFPLPSLLHQQPKYVLPSSDKAFLTQLHFEAGHLPVWVHKAAWVASHKEQDTYLPGQHTKKDEDEHPLEGVEDCKKVGSNHRSLDNMENPKDPGSPKEEEESKSTSGTGSREEENIANNMRACVIFLPSALWMVNVA